MVKYISQKLRAVAFYVDKIACAIYTEPSDKLLTPKEKAHRDWLADRGDRVLRLDYPLNTESVVFDVGGYEGQWASDIFAMHQCVVHVFEPVSKFGDRIIWRFKKNEKIVFHSLALGGEDKDSKININENASSVYGSNGDIELIKVRKLSTMLDSLNLTRIDLLKINIEGLEYDLLDNILNEGLVEKIDNILVQFHDFVPDAEERMTRIQERLSLTHVPAYQYPYIWESWTIKK